jgi:two-component system NarL family sensor kinase
MSKELTFGIAIIFLVFLFLCIWLLVFLIYYQRKKKNYIEDKIRREENYKLELTRVQQEIQEETIRQIGYELHDNIGQLVTVAKIHLQNLMKTGFETQLGEIHTVVAKALDELRRLSKSLDGSAIENMSLEQLLEKDQARINQLGHVHLTFETWGEPVEIDSKKKIILYRMIQEIITNALKHAKCDEIKVEIEYGSGEMNYIVADNGEGFDVSVMNNSETNGSGLRHLKNRANLLGGQLTLTSSEQTGTRYEIKCPKSSLCNIK